MHVFPDSTKYPPELTPDGRTLDVAPPVFTLRTRQAEKQVDKEAGDMFRVRTVVQFVRVLVPTVKSHPQITCEALGSPRPSIRWFKDGQEILESVVPRGRDVQGSSSVELQVLGTVDAGTYTCLARNSVGFKEQNFTLRVIAGRKLASRAVVTAAGDASVATGGRAELRCYVQAQKTPTVQWLKKLQQDQLDHDPSEVLSVHTLRMGSERYQLLQSAEAAEDKESSGRFVSTLVIAEADVSDSGLYLCFVTNAGFGALTYKSARLNVVASQESGDKSFLALMLGVLVASACAGVGVVACLVRARVTKKQQVEEVGKTNQQELQQQRPFLLCESPDLLPPPSLPHAFPPAPMLSWSRRSVYPSETNHYESPTKLMNQYEVPYSHLRSSSQSSHSGNFCASQHNFSASLSSFRQPPQGSRVTAARTLGAPPPLRNYHCSFRYDLQ